MNAITALQILKRRGFERHIHELLRLRRTHPSGSFFSASGEMQPYATAYLYQWLTPELPGGPAAIPSLHWQAAMEECSLEEVRKHQEKPRHWAAAYRFVEVLTLLEREGARLFAQTTEQPDTEACRAAQMDEYRETLTVIDSPRGRRADDDDRMPSLNAV